MRFLTGPGQEIRNALGSCCSYHCRKRRSFFDVDALSESPIKSFLLFSSSQSIQKSRILFEIILRDSAGESSYIKPTVYADERQSLEDQCSLVTGNINGFTFSVRKVDQMDLVSSLGRNPTFLALRNHI